MEKWAKCMKKRCLKKNYTDKNLNNQHIEYNFRISNHQVNKKKKKK